MANIWSPKNAKIRQSAMLSDRGGGGGGGSTGGEGAEGLMIAKKKMEMRIRACVSQDGEEGVLPGERTRGGSAGIVPSFSSSYVATPFPGVLVGGSNSFCVDSSSSSSSSISPSGSVDSGLGGGKEKKKGKEKRGKR